MLTNFHFEKNKKAEKKEVVIKKGRKLNKRRKVNLKWKQKHYKEVGL